jgi:hypothetical protein
MDQQQGVPATNDEELIDECVERLRLGEQSELHDRQEGETDLKFANGEQWDNTLQQERAQDSRPCLTINVTDAVVRRVVNACRENRPRIKVHPVSDATVEDAKVREGLIRHIEDDSNAAYAYDNAVELAIRAGWGYFGIDNEFESPDSFDQVLKFSAYPDSFVCYRDPGSVQPDGSDMQWFIETSFMSRNDYRARFGAIDDDGWKFNGTKLENWWTKEQIRIAKYWYIRHEADKVVRMSDGDVLYKSLLPRKRILNGLNLSIVEERDTVRPVVRVALLTSRKVLRKEDWPGRWIPRFPVYGRQLAVKGERHLKGMIRDLRDPGRMYNYAETAKTETYAMQPKAPWLGAAGFMEGKEAQWRDANRKPIVALEYVPVMQEDGSLAPRPERQNPPQPNAGFAEWSQSTLSNFLFIAGMPNDPNMDLKGEVVSGIAIQRRQGLADLSHFDFYDNLTRTMRHAGRVILDLLPFIYSAPRTLRILGEDGVPQTMDVNQQEVDPQTQAVLKVTKDMTKGRFTCVVDTGPAYATKREQASEAMVELLGTPLGETVAKTSGDLVVRAMDFPNSDAVADRIMSQTPAALLDKSMGEDFSPRAKAMIAGLQAQLKDSNTKQLGLEMELKSKHGLEQMKQSGETEREHIRQQGADRRKSVDSSTRIHDTHVRAQTAHDVAEIHGATQLLNTHAEAGHNERAAEKMLQRAGEAEDRET